MPQFVSKGDRMKIEASTYPLDLKRQKKNCW